MNFIDPNGMLYAKPSDWEREQAREGAVYSEAWWKLAGMMGSQFEFSSGRQYSGNPERGIEVGTHFDWRTGKEYKVYEDPMTGDRYYRQQTGTKYWNNEEKGFELGSASVSPIYSYYYFPFTGCPDDASNSGGDETNRLYDLSDTDVEGLTGVSLAFGIVGAAAVGNVPGVVVIAHVGSGVVTTVITADAYWDYQEIPNPQSSDKAKLGLNLINYGIGLFVDGWSIPSAIIGVIDLNGGFDKFYERFNKKEQ